MILSPKDLAELYGEETVREAQAKIAQEKIKEGRKRNFQKSPKTIPIVKSSTESSILFLLYTFLL